MITFWIDSLPPAGVNVVGSAKSGAAYNAAAEQMRGEVSAVLPTPPETPYTRCAVTVTLYVGAGEPDRYRPEGAWRAKDALEPLFYALIDAAFIESLNAIKDGRVVVSTDWQSEGEGMRVEVAG